MRDTVEYDVRVLKAIKRAVMAAGKSSGAFRLIGGSDWRRSRFLILGYHGVSLQDEHEWDGALYMSPAKFRSRMEAIKRHGCTVLPLQEALELLHMHELPPRSVVLTFDDGTYDFYKNVCPILNEFGYPATLYLTTYWMTLQLPVVPVLELYLVERAELDHRCQQLVGPSGDVRSAHARRTRQSTGTDAGPGGIPRSERRAARRHVQATRTSGGV